MNIHIARTPPVRTAVRRTCCQGQTSGLTVRPDQGQGALTRHSPNAVLMLG